MSTASFPPPCPPPPSPPQIRAQEQEIERIKRSGAAERVWSQTEATTRKRGQTVDSALRRASRRYEGGGGGGGAGTRTGGAQYNLPSHTHAYERELFEQGALQRRAEQRKARRESVMSAGVGERVQELME